MGFLGVLVFVNWFVFLRRFFMTIDIFETFPFSINIICCSKKLLYLLNCLWICFEDINDTALIMMTMRWIVDTCIYIWFDTMIHLVLWWWLAVATRSLWSNLGRSRIVGILWSSGRGCYSWCLAQQRGRVCHGVVVWLIQANTSVR